MTENQESMMKKITIMENWLDEHNKADERIRMNAEERGVYIDGMFNVSQAVKNAKAILKYMQRGQVFDMPKEMEESK